MDIDEPASESGQKGNEKERLPIIPGQPILIDFAVVIEILGQCLSDSNQFVQCRGRFWHKLRVVDQRQMIANLIPNQPGRVFPMHDALRHEPREKLAWENLVERQNRPRGNKDTDIVSRTIDNVRTLSCDCANDKKITQLFVLFIESVDDDV